MNVALARSSFYVATGRRMVRQRARRVLWSLRLLMHPLRTDPRLSMEALVRSLRAGGSPESFEEVRQIRELCRARDRRTPKQRTHGSTRAEDAYFLYLLVRKLRPQAIFEVGTLIGTSASAMAYAQSENGEGAVVYTVDGSYGGFEPIERDSIRCFPGHRSDQALETLRREGRRIDFVFVDGTIGRRDVELLNEIGSRDLVIATHDYKPPIQKGIRNAWMISRYRRGAEASVWVLPERQEIGYAGGDGLFVNSSVAVFLPGGVAERFRAE